MVEEYKDSVVAKQMSGGISLNENKTGDNNACRGGGISHAKRNLRISND